MSRFGRLAIALVIFLSGAVLTPFISLPAEAFGWEEYASAYTLNPGPIHLPVIFKK
ncbi:MAG: hypothetical protein KJ077_46345 [Anaerolineae bacterium]|nr:hypothetical protein [Anaerolineae bacterium]